MAAVDYANIAGRAAAGGGLGAGIGLAVRNLAQRIAMELAKAAISPMTGAGSGDDAGAGAGAEGNDGSEGDTPAETQNEPGAEKKHSPDRQALNDLIREGTANGTRPLDIDDAETILDWAGELDTRKNLAGSAVS